MKGREYGMSTKTEKELEQKYILKYGTYGKGYNLTPGGEDSKALQK